MSGARGQASICAGAVLCLVATAAHAAGTVQDTLNARGEAVFTQRCALCHREGQTGAFVLARRLGKEMSLLEQRGDLQPAYVRQVVRQGLVNMPRISRVEIPDPDLDAVIAYLLSPKATPRTAP